MKARDASNHKRHGGNDAVREFPDGAQAPADLYLGKVESAIAESVPNRTLRQIAL
jgi:hypothetical protein